MKKKRQTTNYQERRLKKPFRWLIGIVSFFLLGLGTVVVQALTLPAGAKQVGTINNAPVVESKTDDTSSQHFRDIISALLEGVGTPPYVVNQVAWTGKTSLYNGKNLSSFGQSPVAVFGADGFDPTDKAILLNVGEDAYIQDVGTALDTKTGKNIPLTLAITFKGARGPGGTPLNKILMGAKSQNTVVTLAWGSPTSVGGGGGGSTEGGGIEGGTNDGTGFHFIEEINYIMTLVNSETGQTLPNDTLMPIKISDIDASQLATMGGQGAKGYILSPNSALSQSGNGFKSNSDGALIEDTINLSTNSYIVLKQYNTNSVQFQYTNGRNDYLDIVTGVFGSTPWNLPDLLGGFIEVDKSTQYGKDFPNGLYNFSDLTFDVVDKNGKVVDTIKLDAKGKGKSKRIPQGDYTLKEKSSKWASTGQTVRADQTTKVPAGDTVVVKPKNVAVTGEITIKKSGVESGNELWNQHYSLAGNEFKLTSQTDKKTYTVITDKTGTAIAKNLPLGVYDIEEVRASDGFVNTFKKQRVTLSYKDNKTAIVFGETSGTNQEIKGESRLEKEDKDTGKESQGKAVLQGAEYGLFYGEDGTGSSPHKKGEAVKWGDSPKATLLKGNKVTSSVINGQVVEHGDNMVLKVDDKELNVAVGNLALGKYEWRELNAPVGYAADKTIYSFELTKKDDQTANIVADTIISKEPLIQIKIPIQKFAEIEGESAQSGYNGVEFTATPLEGTKGDSVTVKTGVHPQTDEDGYAEFVLPYGDYIIEETKGIPGFDDIKPIFIQMTTDVEKDLLTVSASMNKDFSKPFSKRVYAISDNVVAENPNAGEAVGIISYDKPLIMLSKLTFTDKDVPVVTVDPIKDVTKTDGGVSIDKGEVALNSDFIYSLKSSELSPKRVKETEKWTIVDAYNTQFDQFKGTYKVYASTDFGTYKKGDVLPESFFKAEEADGKVTFEATKDFLTLMNQHMKQPIGFEIRADFYRHTFSESVENVFVEHINDEEKESNKVETKTPQPEPHKFTVSEKNFDLTGDKLLDDDGELDDRYADTNKDPYLDTIENNEKENLNTKVVSPKDTLVYQLWLDTRPFDSTSQLTKLGMQDVFDNTQLDADVKEVKVYDHKGKNVTENFDISIKDNELSVFAKVFKEQTNAKGETVNIVDTEKIPLGHFYKIEFPTVVKEEADKDKDIINTAKQVTVDSLAKEITQITEKRVNPLKKKPVIEPHKFTLSQEKYDVTGNKLLADDKEMKDRYKESNENPYADDPKNNQKENINTRTVKPGQKLIYQLWLDARPFNKDSQLTRLRMVDSYDKTALTIDTKQVKVYDKEGKDVTEHFTVTDKDGELTVLANTTKEVTNKKGENISIIDTSNLTLGQYYKIDIPATVKKEVKAGTDIVNVANQEWADSEGEEGKHITEKRVNKVETPSIPKQVAQKVLPQTGDSPSTLAIKISGLLLVAGAGFYFYRRRQEQLLLKSLFDSKELQDQDSIEKTNGEEKELN